MAVPPCAVGRTRGHAETPRAGKQTEVRKQGISHEFREGREKCRGQRDPLFGTTASARPSWRPTGARCTELTTH